MIAAALALPVRAVAQCDPAQDQRVLNAVEAEIRAGLGGRASEPEIATRVAAAQERIRAGGSLSCGSANARAAGGNAPGRQYGAIAANAGGAWGVSWSQASQPAADARAIRECGGGSCEVRVRVAGPACGAYAANGVQWGWGIDATPAAAQSRALAECAKDGGGCRVVAYTCNARP